MKMTILSKTIEQINNILAIREHPHYEGIEELFKLTNKKDIVDIKEEISNNVNIIESRIQILNITYRINVIEMKLEENTNLYLAQLKRNGYTFITVAEIDSSLLEEYTADAVVFKFGHDLTTIETIKGVVNAYQYLVLDDGTYKLFGLILNSKICFTSEPYSSKADDIYFTFHIKEDNYTCAVHLKDDINNLYNLDIKKFKSRNMTIRKHILNKDKKIDVSTNNEGVVDMVSYRCFPGYYPNHIVLQDGKYLFNYLDTKVRSFMIDYDITDPIREFKHDKTEKYIKLYDLAFGD